MRGFKKLQKGDVVAIMYGFDYLIVRVIKNTDGCIVWTSLKWLEESACVSTYEEMNKFKWKYLGKMQPWHKRIFGKKWV